MDPNENGRSWSSESMAYHSSDLWSRNCENIQEEYVVPLRRLKERCAKHELKAFPLLQSICESPPDVWTLWFYMFGQVMSNCWLAEQILPELELYLGSPDLGLLVIEYVFPPVPHGAAGLTSELICVIKGLEEKTDHQSIALRTLASRSLDIVLAWIPSLRTSAHRLLSLRKRSMMFSSHDRMSC
jgi:hypothetical protein